VRTVSIVIHPPAYDVLTRVVQSRELIDVQTLIEPACAKPDICIAIPGAGRGVVP
jgi:hypothetical protein